MLVLYLLHMFDGVKQIKELIVDRGRFLMNKLFSGRLAKDSLFRDMYPARKHECITRSGGSEAPNSNLLEQQQHQRM
jgi:hypothetical protein